MLKETYVKSKVLGRYRLGSQFQQFLPKNRDRTLQHLPEAVLSTINNVDSISLRGYILILLEKRPFDKTSTMN